MCVCTGWVGDLGLVVLACRTEILAWAAAVPNSMIYSESSSGNLL